MKMSSSSMKIVMALALCLLLLGGFSAEAAGRINERQQYQQKKIKGSCFRQADRCPSAKDCNSCCTSLGYNPGTTLLNLCCCLEK
ncbi:hypothetical protein MKW98_022146 [Papaver atlanticum]|uniref:Uncharacterized protein n=1 Tax=Papaver atlanticum TaxID=357466 RepID=A0AAD4T2I5_9MAGN|nr:hypothetical protein MKW98_022146 [Papaver atlanticum]